MNRQHGVFAVAVVWGLGLAVASWLGASADSRAQSPGAAAASGAKAPAAKAPANGVAEKGAVTTPAAAAETTANPATSPLTPAVTVPVLDNDKDKTSPASSPSPLPGELRPEIVYLRDKNQELVPVPNLSLSEFLELTRKPPAAETSAQQPAATLQQLSLTGTALKHAAEFAAEFEVRMHDEHSGWVRIPLGLREAAWMAPLEYEGPGEQIVHFDREADEYVCWLKAAPNTKHLLRAKLVVPVTGGGQERRLAMNMPLAGAATLTMRVPTPRAVVLTSTGTPEAEVRLGENQTATISVLGVKGDYVLAWRELDEMSDNVQPIIEANGQQFIRIDGRTVATEARLTLRSYGAAFDRVRVKLPPKALLAGGSNKGYAITTVAGSNGEQVEVLFDEKTLGPVEAVIQTERVLDVNAPNEAIELAGFEVLDALPHRQGGFVGISLDGDWRLAWEKQSRVRAAAEFPGPRLNRDFAAVWEYVGEPYQLECRILPRKTLLTVDADHLLTLTDSRATLDTQLQYNIRGARAGSLTLDLNGWIFDMISPETLVNVAGIPAETSGQMQISLLTPTTGKLDLRLRAHREIRVAADALSFPLPIISADVPGSITLTVAPASNLELRPVAELLQQLTRLPSAAGNSDSHGGWSYRVEKQPAVFAARLRVMPRETRALSLLKCRIEGDSCRVEQQLEYRVAHQAVTALEVEAPEKFPRQTAISWELDGQAVTPLGAPRWQAETKRWRWILPLAAPRLGVLTLTARYLAPHPAVTPQGSKITLQLLQPVADVIARQELTLTPAAGLLVGCEQLEAGWTLRQGSRAEPQALPFRLMAETPLTEATFSLKQISSVAAPKIYVERTWLQTWLTNAERQERAVFQLLGPQRPERITLPPGAIAGEAQVFWNREPLPTHVISANEIGLYYPVPDQSGPRVLELRYRYEAAPSLWRIAAELPQLGQDAWNQQFYWQLITPAQWHLLWGPGDLQSESTWTWQENSWGRVPLWEQNELEIWSGAIAEEALPSTVNRYLYSGRGNRWSEPALAVPRWLLIWLGAAIGLGGGFLIWRYRAARHPLSLLALAVALAAGGSIWPEPLLLLGQAALLGVPLLLIAGLLRRAMGTSTTASAGGSSTTQRRPVERGSTQSRAPLPPLSHHSGSTATAALPANLESSP